MKVLHPKLWVINVITPKNEGTVASNGRMFCVSVPCFQPHPHIQSHPITSTPAGISQWCTRMVESHVKGSLKTSKGGGCQLEISFRTLRIGNCGTPSKWPDMYGGNKWGIEKPLTKWDDTRSRAHTGNFTKKIGSMVSSPNVHQPYFSS